MALALIGGLALAGFSKVFAVVFLGEPRDPKISVHATPQAMNIGMAALGLGCGLVGLAAFGVAPMLARAVAALVDDGGSSGLAAASLSLRGLNDSLGALGRLALPMGAFVVMAIVLVLVRRHMPPCVRAGGSGGTWGCGFAAPVARMQYTASSFVGTLIHHSRFLVRTRRHGIRPAGCFPQPQRLSTQTPDVALERGYEPMFAGLARACQRLSPLQHGRIQLYLAYIVGTVVMVFIVEAALGPVGGSFNRPGAATEQPSHAVRTAIPNGSHTHP